MVRLPALVACALALAAAPRGEGDLPPTLTLSPAVYRVNQGQTLDIRVRDARDGRTLPSWPVARAEDLCIRSETIQTNLDSIAPINGAVSMVAPPGNCTMLALELRPVDLALHADELQRMPGLCVIGEATPPEGELRVAHFESLKSLLQVRAPLVPVTASAIATSKVGHESEIRLLADPGVLSPGADLPIRAYAGGSSLKNGHVLAICTASGETQRVQLDRAGIGNVKLNTSGEWRIEIQALKRAAPGADHEWHWYTATISFELLNGPGK